MLKKDTLDFEQSSFDALLERTKQILIELYEKIDDQPGYHQTAPKEVQSWFDEQLPREGSDPEALLSFVNEKVVKTATGNAGPHMYAYVMAGGNQMSAIADTISNHLDQNPTKWHLAPAMNEIERLVVRWTTEMIGYHPEAGGVMVSGGSAANLTGLTVARNVFFEHLKIKETGLFGLKPFTVYCSAQVHSCIDKSLETLGIGTNQLRKIETDEDFRINTRLLEQTIKEDIEAGFTPFCIVGTAGTVNTGAIDDLDTLADLTEKYQMWFHIDGAYGGLVSSLENMKEYYKGMERADSIALDFHKWLYQPFEAGCALIRSWTDLKKTYFKQADYLDTSLEDTAGKLEFNEHYFQVSRNAKAFKVWMSIKAYGIDRIKAMIQKDIDLTHYIAEQVESSADFELITTSQLAVVCFRYVGALQTEEDIETLNEQLVGALEEDGRVFITSTRIHGRLVLRACLINHRKTKASSDFLIRVIREVAVGILNE